MEQQDEWGPWIEHNGSGCPVQNGTFVEALTINRDWCVFHEAAIVMSSHIPCSSWTMRDNQGRYTQVIRYRIRKPRGMIILEALLQDLPQTVQVE